MDDFIGLDEKQIARINRIREERAIKKIMGPEPPTTRFGEPISTGQFGFDKSAAEAVFTNPDLLKTIGSFTNPKADGFLVFVTGKEVIEVGKSLKATRPSQQKSMFIGRYRPMKIPAAFQSSRSVFVELFWPNINSKKDNDSKNRLEQKNALNFLFPRFNQDIFTKSNLKERVFFLPLNVLLKVQYPYGDFPYGEGEIDKIKKQAYFNDLDYPVLTEEKLLDKIN
jgi:hypothetical protein